MRLCMVEPDINTKKLKDYICNMLYVKGQLDTDQWQAFVHVAKNTWVL
jgi:hypothetical protein